MKRILQLVCLIAISVPSLGQGSGVGYILDIGWSNKSQSTPVYYQSIRTITHNGFIRFHNGKGNNALQLMAGYRMDTISFQNFSQFLGSDGTSMMQYNSNAFIRRDAHRQWGAQTMAIVIGKEKILILSIKSNINSTMRIT
ncbi:hypothetical protein ES703_113458 [subsurface metagenome]